MGITPLSVPGTPDKIYLLQYAILGPVCVVPGHTALGGAKRRAQADAFKKGTALAATTNFRQFLTIGGKNERINPGAENFSFNDTVNGVCALSPAYGGKDGVHRVFCLLEFQNESAGESVSVEYRHIHDPCRAAEHEGLEPVDNIILSTIFFK